MEIARLYPLISLVRELSTVRNADELLDRLVEMGTWVLNADGCSCWLASGEALRFASTRTASLDLRLKASDHDEQVMSIDLNSNSFVAEVARQRTTLRVADIHASSYNAQFAQRFDVIYNYKTCAMIGVPLIDGQNALLGVLQIVNPVARQEFDEEDVWLADALGSCATLVLATRRQSDAAMELFRSMVKVLTKAVDLADPTTSGHRRRVPLRVREMAEAMDRQSLRGFRLDDATAETLWLAAMLHDVGTLGVPSRILNKLTRLDGYLDRIELIRYRAKLIEAGFRLDAEISQSSARRDDLHARLANDLHWIELINSPRAVLTDDDVRRIARIAADQWRLPDGSTTALISDDEAVSLSAKHGTLSAEERKTVERHVEYSVDLLSEIPWPRSLQRVKETVAGHHERLDGSGYPTGTRDIPLLARIMSVCDIWDALTAPDRVGRRSLSPDEAVERMTEMAENGQIDMDLWQFFVKEGFHLKSFDEIDTANLAENEAGQGVR
jgi:HD-GYP domain-containing protein (c-di-GMP phosphodiesterase class II)